MQRAPDAAGIDVRIVNARHVKRVPGRKTDVSDSRWLAALARCGLVTPSFAAPPELEEVRRLTRLHARTRQLASKARNMLHRLPDESGLRIGGILTDLFGASGRALPAGLIEGLEEERMLRGVQGRARGRIPALREALEGGLADEVRPVAALMLRTLDGIERTLADLEGRILEAAERDWEVPWTLLQTLPGAGPLAAAALLAETGADTGQFGTAAGEPGGHVPGQPRVGGQGARRLAPQGQRVPAAHPRGDRARGIADQGRAVRAAQAGGGAAARHGPGGGGAGPSHPAHRVRHAAGLPPLRGSRGGLRGGHGAPEPGALDAHDREGEADAAGGAGGGRVDAALPGGGAVGDPGRQPPGTTSRADGRNTASGRNGRAVPPVSGGFRRNGSVHPAPPFPRTGPGGPGSPPSPVLCGRYDSLRCIPSTD